MGALAADLALVTLVGSVLALDRRGAFQMMASQPLVVVSVLGLMLGDFQTGLRLGAVLQLLWLSTLLVGASVPPNETVAATVIGGTTLLYGKYVGLPDAPVQALAVLLGAPMAQVGRWVEIRLDRENLALAALADEAARAGEPALIGRLPFKGLFRALVATALVTAPALALGLAVLRLVRPELSVPLTRAFEVLGVYIIPALAMAVALSTVRRRRAVALAGIAFIVVLLGLRSGGET